MSEWQCKTCGTTDVSYAYLSKGKPRKDKCKREYCAVAEQNGMPYGVMLALVSHGCRLADNTCKGRLHLDHDHLCTYECPFARGRGTRGTNSPCREPMCIRGMLCASHNMRDMLCGDNPVDIKSTEAYLIAGYNVIIYEGQEWQQRVRNATIEDRIAAIP